MNQLDELKKLVIDGGWDDESKKQVLDLETRLQDLSIRENLGQHPAIKPFIDYLTTEISRCDMLLRKHQGLDDRSRDRLFAIVDIAEHFTSVFSGKARQSAEDEIKKLLDVATNNANALSA